MKSIGCTKQVSRSNSSWSSSQAIQSDLILLGDAVKTGVFFNGINDNPFLFISTLFLCLCVMALCCSQCAHSQRFNEGWDRWLFKRLSPTSSEMDLVKLGARVMPCSLHICRPDVMEFYGLDKTISCTWKSSPSFSILVRCLHITRETVNWFKSESSGRLPFTILHFNPLFSQLSSKASTFAVYIT